MPSLPGDDSMAVSELISHTFMVPSNDAVASKSGVVRLELTVKDGLYVTLYNTVHPNKKKTHFISEISSLPHKI